VTIPSGTPVLAPAPGTIPGPGANTGRLYDSDRARRLDAAASAFDRVSDGWTMHRLTVIRPATATDPGQYESQTFPASSLIPGAYDHWLDHVWPAAACSHPIRLRGIIRRVDPATGEVRSAVSTDDLPDKVIYKPCGNRRATACPGCAEVYRRDSFQLIRAGLAGGKGVPEAVAGHPAVFATFTAPSFGPVHARPVRLHSCADRSACACKPQPCHARRDPETCPHGVTLACFTRHGKNDPRIGQPLCADCYDYNAHAVWNNAAGELWRRTKQDIERHLIQLAEHRGYPTVTVEITEGGITRRIKVPPVRLSHGKAAEYQARGAVHFHVLLRLDGVNPADPARIVPPPPGITVADLDDAVRRAASIAWRTRPHPVNRDGWVIGWGSELDIRVITMRGTRTVTDYAVASYLAKYSTKGTETAGHASARITPDTIDLYANPDGTHPERLIHAAWKLGSAHGQMYGTAHQWNSLRRWAHMLGFGGHFLTKARRYSVTLTALRQARITYRRGQDTGPDHQPLHSQDNPGSETAIILTWLSYAGTGWHTTGDALLANTAADQARKRREAGHEEVVSEYAEAIVSEAA
jgi:hypothetical protein